MLAVPLKKASERQPFEKSLRAFLTSEFASSDLDAPVAAFCQLRADVHSVKTPAQISRFLLVRYFSQWQKTSSRFARFNFAFGWSDSFAPRQKVNSTDVNYEIASVMFNYGALESQSAVQEDRSSVTGLQKACKSFMSAAGVFTTLKNDICPQIKGPKPSDLSSEGLQFLIQLMLAQAQACFYEKAVKDKLAPSLKAKLSMGACDLYSNALSSGSRLKTLDRMWCVHIDFQLNCLSAASSFWAAQVAKEKAEKKGQGYGEEITRLKKCLDDCQLALNVATKNKLPSSLPQSVQQLKTMAHQQFISAQKDNNSIYMESVPALNDLAPLGKACMVKAQPLSADVIEEASQEDLFAGLLSRSVFDNIQTAKGLLISKKDHLNEQIKGENDQARTTLQEMGLPASLEAMMQNDNTVSDSIWQQIEDVQQQRGGVDALKEKLHINETHSKVVERELETISRLLGEEEVADNICAQNYGPNVWTRTKSSELSRGFRSDIDRFYKLVHEAKQSDHKLNQRVSQNITNLQQFLNCTRTSLNEMFANVCTTAGTSPTTSNQQIDTSRLSQLMTDLSDLIQRRNSLFDSFSTKVDNFTPAPAALEGDANPDTMVASFTAELETQLSDAMVEQSGLLDAIARENDIFLSQRSANPVLLSKQRLISDITKTVLIYEEVYGSLSEGAQFYSDLSERVLQLKQTVEDHVAARNLEKQDLEVNLKPQYDHYNPASFAPSGNTNMTSRQQQEQEDALLAQKLSSSAHISVQEEQARQMERDEKFAKELAQGLDQSFESKKSSALPPAYAAATSAPNHSSNSHNAPPPPYGNPVHQQQQSYGNFSSSAPPPSPPQHQNIYNQQYQPNLSHEHPHRGANPAGSQGSYSAPKVHQNFQNNASMPGQNYGQIPANANPNQQHSHSSYPYQQYSNQQQYSQQQHHQQQHHQQQHNQQQYSNNPNQQQYNINPNQQHYSNNPNQQYNNYPNQQQQIPMQPPYNNANPNQHNQYNPNANTQYNQYNPNQHGQGHV